MNKIVQYGVVGVVMAMIATIVFVRAGEKGGTSGGAQSASIINAAGTSFAEGARALTGA